MGNDERHRMEVIPEDINSKFDLVLEGHATLEQMIREHRTETRQDKQELLALIKTSHDTLDEKIDTSHNSLERKIKASHDSLEGKIKASHDSLDKKIDGVAARLSAEIQAVGDKVENHEQRITSLERKVA